MNKLLTYLLGFVFLLLADGKAIAQDEFVIQFSILNAYGGSFDYNGIHHKFKFTHHKHRDSIKINYYYLNNRELPYIKKMNFIKTYNFSFEKLIGALNTIEEIEFDTNDNTNLITHPNYDGGWCCFCDPRSKILGKVTIEINDISGTSGIIGNGARLFQVKAFLKDNFGIKDF
ncbi:hypothetical protein R9C00_21790 [Flammeovirgaceae bacterium SG7u.111]|nr:hypothetical protein [Flammeovirgaceae bacterium SG7u.132]WPO34335.1 hypothetical protein R9C00_21790 [Flammeovirgaceae bacterium SG7u.111]